jgi:hypothetical protein
MIQDEVILFAPTIQQILEPFVNFNNFLQAAFAPKFLRQKLHCQIVAREKI